MEKIINLYNNERPHQSISFFTTEAVHLSGIHTERKWKNYYAKKEIQPDLSIVPKVKSLQAMGNNLSSHVGNVDKEYSVLFKSGCVKPYRSNPVTLESKAILVKCQRTVRSIQNNL